MHILWEWRRDDGQELISPLRVVVDKKMGSVETPCGRKVLLSSVESRVSRSIVLKDLMLNIAALTDHEERVYVTQTNCFVFA